MYEQEINRQTPTCVVFLLDRSDSMNRPWAASGMTLAQGAARAVNKALFNLAVQSRKNERIRHYFDVGVFGYGLRTSDGQEGVEPAWGGALAGRGLVSITELTANPLREEETPSVDAGGAPVRMPVWVEPVYGKRTPMCEAIAVAGGHIYEWIQKHPSSFPPVVMNITDGFVTDSPHGGATLEEWAARLPTLQTHDGGSLLFNVFLSPDGDPPKLFPTSADGLPAPGPQLFRTASVLPVPMVQRAQALGVTVPPSGRAFCFNADFASLNTLLDVGTQRAKQAV